MDKYHASTIASLPAPRARSPLSTRSPACQLPHAIHHPPRITRHPPSTDRHGTLHPPRVTPPTTPPLSPPSGPISPCLHPAAQPAARSSTYHTPNLAAPGGGGCGLRRRDRIPSGDRVPGCHVEAPFQRAFRAVPHRGWQDGVAAGLLAYCIVSHATAAPPQLLLALCTPLTPPTSLLITHHALLVARRLLPSLTSTSHPPATISRCCRSGRRLPAERPRSSSARKSASLGSRRRMRRLTKPWGSWRCRCTATSTGRNCAQSSAGPMEVSLALHVVTLHVVTLHVVTLHVVRECREERLADWLRTSCGL